MQITRAAADEHKKISNITKLSKAHWGYKKEWMDMWDEELTISPDYIRGHTVYKIIYQSKIVGYYSLTHISKVKCELDNLFVLPEYIGQGFGKILIGHAIETAQYLGMEEIVLDADPNAAGFYEKHGFIEIGKKETKIPGRFFSVMSKKITWGLSNK